QRAGRGVDAGHAARRRDEQLSARADSKLSAVDCGAAEFLAGPPRSASDRRCVCGGEGADFREPGRPRLGGDQRGRSGGAAHQPGPGGAAAVRARRGARGRHDDRGGWIVDRQPAAVTPLVPLTAIHLLGRHLLYDVMAAATASSIAGATPRAMTTAVDTFKGLEHAMELVAEIGGVRFVNDSKATNVEAAARSL